MFPACLMVSSFCVQARSPCVFTVFPSCSRYSEKVSDLRAGQVPKVPSEASRPVPFRCASGSLPVPFRRIWHMFSENIGSQRLLSSWGAFEALKEHSRGAKTKKQSGNTRERYGNNQETHTEDAKKRETQERYGNNQETLRKRRGNTQETTRNA